MNQMRGVAGHQDSALDGAAPGDADVAGRQVAQTAVDQFGTPAAGAERQIVLFHQRHPQTARRGIQGDPGAGDAAADDDDVERFAVGQCAQVGGAARGVQGGRSASRQVSVQ